jgi:hypothetical protein
LDAHGRHHAHLDLLVLGLPPPWDLWDLRGVKVRRVALVQHLPLSHLAGTIGWSTAPWIGGAGKAGGALGCGYGRDGGKRGGGDRPGWVGSVTNKIITE